MVKRTSSKKSEAPAEAPAAAAPAVEALPNPAPVPSPVPPAAAPEPDPSFTLFEAIVRATKAGSFVHVATHSLASYIGDPRGPLVEVNSSLVDADNKPAVRASALGLSVYDTGTFFAPPPPPVPAPPPAASGWGAPAAAPAASASPPAPPPTTPAAAPAAPKPPAPVDPSIVFEDGVPVPTITRGGRGRPGYGFENMNVGQSFFIPKTADNEKPAKRIASTVSSANERLAPKKFTARSVEEKQPDGSVRVGARVWRIA